MSSSSILDPRERRFITPTRLVWQSTGEAAPANPEVLLLGRPGQAITQATTYCSLNGPVGKVAAGGLVLDFGRELHGGVQLVTGPGNSLELAPRVRIRFGESVSEVMNEPNNDHTLHDFETTLPGMGSMEFGQTGFRFVRIDVLEEDAVVQLASVRAVSLMRPLEAIGSFRSSDARLNEIWQVGADTVHLCMQDFVWDGIKRDRLVWLGDMHPEVSVISRVWGAHSIVPDSLDWIRDHDPLPQWMNGIGSYSMWWVIIQRDWYLHHGDAAYLEAQRTYLLELLGIFCTGVEENGAAVAFGFEFLDWPSYEDTTSVKAGLQALVTLTLAAGGELCDTLGEAATAARCRAALTVLEATPPTLSGKNKQASALLALAKLVPVERVNTEVLAENPLQGLSTFYGYYILQARAVAGDYLGALDVIRHYWGGMLDLGATSFWEHFDLEWAANATRIDELPKEGLRDIHRQCGAHCYKGLRHSLCHGWAAGPTAWLSEHVLGITPLETSCRRVRVAPHLADLEWAEGSFPTPFGPITVRHERTATGQIESEITAPSECEIVLENAVLRAAR
jgi:alpha-L-rhamnosidase